MQTELKQDLAAYVTERLFENAASTRYGAVSVILKLHDWRIADIIFSTTENRREVL